MRPLKIVSIVIGALLIIVGLGLLVPGAFLLWLHESQRDEAGFYETSSRAVVTETYALTSPEVDVHLGDVRDWIPEGWTGTARLRVESSSKELFIGIGPTDRVAAYLSGVAHDEMQNFAARGTRIEYRRIEGGPPPTRPGDQDFWVASTSGSGPLEWDVLDGDWTAVLMNADASAGVQADLRLGARLDFLFPIAVGLLVAGVVLLLIGVVLVILGARPSRQEPLPSGTYAGVPPEGYGGAPYPPQQYQQQHPQQYQQYPQGSYPPLREGVAERPSSTEERPPATPPVPPPD